MADEILNANDGLKNVYGVDHLTSGNVQRTTRYLKNLKFFFYFDFSTRSVMKRRFHGT